MTRLVGILIVVLTIVAIMLFGMSLGNILTGQNLGLSVGFLMLSMLDFVIVARLVMKKE